MKDLEKLKEQAFEDYILFADEPVQPIYRKPFNAGWDGVVKAKMEIEFKKQQKELNNAIDAIP